MKPLLSIIIPTWNTATITQKCIHTINHHLHHKITYEIIVVDNHSTDNTIKLLSKEPNTILIQNSQNLGFSKACNIGSKKAQAKNLFFLNSDMEFIDDNLLLMMKFLDNNPEIGLIGPKFLNPDLTPQASAFPPQTPLNAIKEYWLQKTNSYSKYLPSGSSPVKVDSISGGAVLIKRRLFEKAGQWNEKYFMYYEDLDLCRQIRKLKKMVYYFPAMKVIHRHGASGKKLAAPQNQWRRLIPSSKRYHGLFKHYLINFILWSGQKWQKYFHN